MEALHFGAGNIGRGFIGKLLSESGYRVNFVDINEAVIRNLADKGEYVVEVVGEESKKEIILAQGGDYYTIQQGDTLYSLSKRFKLSVDDLKKLNNMSDNAISIGQQIKIK